MKSFLETAVAISQIDTIQCNVCGRTVQRNSFGYFSDHISLTKCWGYHSPYDGEAHAIDLCVDCYTSWTAQFEIPPLVEELTEFV